MKETNAYQTSDGRLFINEGTAKAHEDDLLGQEIDGLLRLYGLDITRNQEYKGCLSVMDKRKELKEAATKLLAILNHEED